MFLCVEVIMKNVVFGIIGAFIALYLILISVTIYSVYTRKNKLEHVVSDSIKNTMDTYYDLEKDEALLDSASVKVIVVEDIEERLCDAPGLSVDVLACDMDKGIISVRVSEKIKLPTGKRKKLWVSKTIIVDREGV